VRFAFIAAETAAFPVRLACRVLGAPPDSTLDIRAGRPRRAHAERLELEIGDPRGV
jgi:hypothetical protein